VLNRFLLLASGATSLILAALPARAETLEEAVITAHESSPSLEIRRALTRAADERVVQADAAYGPSLSVNASHEFTYSRTRFTEFQSEDDGFATSGSLNLTQPLFTSGRLAAAVDIAEASRLAARQDLRGESQQLILDVVTAYVSLQRDLELYQVAGDIYQLLLQQRDITASRLQLRDATAPDVDQTENRMQLAAGRVIEARASVESSAARYRNLVGQYPDTLAPPAPLPPLPELATLYEIAEQRSPSLLSAQYTELASRAQVAAARAAQGPQVSGSASAGRSPASAFQNTNYVEQVVAGVNLSVQLYSGGLQSSVVRETLERNIAAQNLVEQSRRDMRQSLASDWYQLRAADETLPRYLLAVEAAQRAVDGVKQQETSGIRTLRDVLDVTNDLFNARTSAVVAQTNRYIAHASVLRDAGMLSVDLFGAGASYDPADYAPAGARLAGLPLQPVVEPIDRILLNDWVDPAGVDVEADPIYDAGAQLPDLLVPRPR